MSIASEFKEFAMKGNVIDMAVGVIIGGAFGKIVSSLVGDVIMPPLGRLLAGVDFTELAATVGTSPEGEPILLRYGAFIQTVLDFLIIAFVIFMAIKGLNKLKKAPPPKADEPPPPPPRDEQLLEEIRDLLKQRQ
jgi:large conductance mechanosensitive channel